MSQIDDFLSGKPSGSKSEIDGFLGEDKPKGGFGAAAKQAVGAVVKGAGQAVEDFAPDAVGKDNAIKRYGQGVIDANPTAVTSGQDILDSPWTAVKEAVGNAAGSMGPMLGARALGMGVTAAAPLTGPFAPATALAGQAIANVGPFVAAALPSFGGIREKQIEKDPNSQSSTQDKAVAALGAGTVGLIEGKFGPEAAALKMMTQQGRAALGKKFAETTLAKGIGYGALKGAAVEGAEELAQNPIEQLAAYDDPRTPENIKDTLFGGAMGAIGGGVLGGGVGAVNQVVGKKRDATVTPQPADTQPADPLLIGNTPDPYLSFADGTVARKSEIDAYIGGLPEDQQPAARAKIMGLAPQPADTTDQASQEATASLDASRDQAIESGGLVPDLPAKPSEAMGLAPTAGPSLANAAILSVDTGIHQAATAEVDPYNAPLSALGQELSKTNQRLRQEADALGLDTEGLHGDAARMTDGKPHEDYLMAANDQLRKAMKAAKEIPDEGQRSGSDDPAPGGEAKGPVAQAGKAPAGNAAGPVGAGAVRPSVDRVGEHGQRAAGTDGGNLPGAVGATSSGPASAGIGQAPQTISQPSPGSDQRQPNTAEPAPGTPKSGAQSEPAPVAVQGVGSGSSSGNNTTGTTRDQAISKASEAASKVLASGGTDADANRAATDSLIDQMATTPGIAIAQDAPAAVKAAKAKPPANNNAQTTTSAPAAPAAGLPAAGSAPVQAAGVGPAAKPQGALANVPQPAQPGTQASQTPSTQGAAPAGAVTRDSARQGAPSPEKQKALDRIASGKAWFGNAVKAQEFISKNGLKDTHKVIKSEDGKRWDVAAKTVAETQASTPEETGKDVATSAAQDAGALSPSLSAKLQEAHKALGRDVTRPQVKAMRDRIANEVDTGRTNNGGVVATLTPLAIKQRQSQLARLDADLALFDEAKTTQPQGATSEPQADQAQQAEAQRPQEPAAAAEPVAAGEALQSAMGAAGWAAEVAGAENTIWTKRTKKDRYTAILTPESNSMEITVLVDTVDTQIASFKVADPKDAAIAANKAVSDDVADSVPAVANPKIKAAPDKKNEADAEPVAARTATEHAGMKIYPTKVKVGDAVVDMWGVQTKDNARREKNGERQIGGDPLSETLDGAKKNAEAEVRDAKSRAEREAESKAADDAAQAKKDANKGKSILQRRADALLDKQHTYPPQAGLGQGTRREAMQKSVDQGRAIVERMVPDTAAKHRDQTAIDLVKARGYILGLSNENIPVVKQGLEAQARMKANQYEKPEYRVYDSAKTDGGFYEITKTEFDYAKSLTEKAKDPHENYIKSAADSIARLRKSDVYRVLDSLAKDNIDGVTREGLADYIKKNHPDYAQEVDDVLTELSQPTPATPVHQDPGAAPEAATAPVIAESLEKAAKKEERPLAEMKAELLGMIDAAIKETPDYDSYLAQVEKHGAKIADAVFSSQTRNIGNNWPEGKRTILFDVPGDGKFTVVNSYNGLTLFRAKIAKASGNGFSETKRPGLPASTSVKKGSTNQISAIESMLEDGDLQAAKDYMAAVGIGTDGLKKSALDRMEQLEALGDKAQEALYTRIDPEWQYSVDRGSRRATLTRTIGKDVYRAWVNSGVKENGEPNDFGTATYSVTVKGGKAHDNSAPSFHDALVFAQNLITLEERNYSKNDGAESQDTPASKAKDAEATAELNLMGFTKAPTGNGTFTLSDSNMRVTVEPTGTGLQARMGSGTSGPRLTEQQAIEWAATMRDESIRIQKAEAKAKPEVSKTGKLPVFPVDAYRLERFYANGAKIKPLPARTFSLQEVQSITDWFKSIGWSVTSGSGGNGINATNDIGMTIDDLPEPYTAAQRKKDEALLASDERAAAKKKEQEGYLTSTAAGKFVAGMFGDAMNRSNQVALAKVLSGDEKTFAGLFSNSAADVLSEAGISAEGREIKDVIRDIKAMFDTAPTSTAKEPWQMTEAEFGEVERQKALANIKYDLERAKNGSLKPFVSGDKSKPALVRRLTAEVAQIESAKPEGYAGDHLAQINKALREGKPVPEVNLKRYDIAAPATPAQKTPSNTGNAGDELSYNRRNRIKTGVKWDDLAGKDEALRIKETNKQNVYPRPDYQALVDDGMNPLVAHIVKQAYDAISTTPNVGNKVASDAALQGYIEGVNRYMEGVMSWANNPAQTNQWLRKIGQSASASLGAMRGTATSLSALTETSDKNLYETVYPGGWRAFEAEVRLIGGNKVLSAVQPSMSDAQKAMKDIGKGWPEKQEAWQKQGYTVVSGSGLSADFYSGNHMDGKKQYTTAWVLNKTDRKNITIEQQSFDGAPDVSKPLAQAWAAQRIAALDGKHVLMSKGNTNLGAFDTLEAAQEKARELTRKEAKSGKIKDAGISVEAAERQGVSHRMEGEDITSDRLKETFGLRGVNFGTWMLGESPSLLAERQLHLNHAYDSLMDLAALMGVPPKAMSLDGLLGLAIGAQGSGGAAAHFVPGVNEINLTRTSGAGSLAHEWGHALDHYFARQAELTRQDRPFLTSHVDNVKEDGYVLRAGQKVKAFGEVIRPEIVAAFRSIVKAMTDRKMTQEEHDANRKASEESSRKNIDGWLANFRRQYDRVSKQPGAPADSMAKFDALAERIKALDLGEGKVAAGNDFAMSPVVSDLRDLYKAMTGRGYSLDEIKGLQSNIDALKYKVDAMAAGVSHVPNRDVPTRFAEAAAKLDKEKGGKLYWSTKLEMFARAFDAFVSDKLDAIAAKNTYLSHAGRTGDTVPNGSERTAINASIQTLIDTIETKDTDKGVAMFSRGTPFYSELSRQIEAANINAAPGFGWKATIKGLTAKGVKADEITWSGIEEWLDLQTGKVTKAAVLEYLAANGVQVEEVTLGAPDYSEVEAWWNDEGGANEEAPFGELSEREKADAAERYVEEVGQYAEGDRQTPKYAKYQLPGGSNYREVLLTLPEKQNVRKRVLRKDGDGRRPWRIYIEGEELHQNSFTTEEAAREDLAKYPTFSEKAGGQAYQSNHWDQQNVLAHIRVNDRVDADGKRVLFVEEIQSDFGQEGKKRGFSNAKLNMEKPVVVFNAKTGENMARFKSGAEAEAYIQQQDPSMAVLDYEDTTGRGGVEEGKVPLAPFVDKTDKWLTLALKRVVKMAVDGGYDKVAFVNGKQSADRYALSSAVETINWRKNGAGTDKIVSVETERGNTFDLFIDGEGLVGRVDAKSSGFDRLAGQNLSEIVGKDFAGKILTEDRGDVSGKGLDIGGEGMKTFYDALVPNATKALLKKLGGGQMEDVRFREDRGFEDSYQRSKGMVIPPITQTGFTITPAMQEKASGGLPLFRRQLAKFSRGAQKQANNAVQSTVDKLTADWQNKPEIVIAFDMQDEAIPDNVRLEDAKQRSGGAFGNPEGFYYRGVVYLLSSQLATDADIARVLAHESLGHYGLRGLYGKALKPILQQIATMRRADVIAVARQRGLVKVDGNNRPIVDVKTATNAQVWAAMTDSHKSQSAEEVLAEMAQTTPQAGFVKRAVAAIRQWLREHGVNLKLTDNDIIVNYILPARGWVERGPGGGGPKGGVSFARGAKSGDAENTRYTRQWYDRLVSLLPDSYRNDPYRREPLPAEGRDVQQAREVQDKIDALNKQIRGPRDTKGHGPVTRDELGNLTVDAREATYSEIIGEIKDLADEIGYGVTVTGVQRGLIEKFRQAGFESEISLAAIADRITGARAEISDEKSAYAVQALGTIMSYKPRGFPMALFSRATTARDLTQKATEAVRVFTNTPGKVNWWHKTVGTQYNLAQRSPEFKRVYDAVQDFIGDVSFYATEAADLAPKILPKLDTWRDIAKSPLSADDTKAIAAPIFEGTLVWARDEAGRPVKIKQLEDEAALMSSDRKAQRLLRNDKISEGVLKMWRGLPMEQYEALIDGKYEKEMLKGGLVWSDAELKSQFNLNDGQIALYREFRASTDKSLTNLAISDMLYFGGKDVAPIKEAVLDAKTVDEAAEMLRDYLLGLADLDPENSESLIATANKMIDKGDRASDLMARGYAPLSRFGTYTLDVVDADGERVYFGLFESRFEADRMAKQMAVEYPGSTVEQGTLSEESYKLFAGVSPETVALFGDMLGLEDNGAYQDYLKLAKSTRSAMKRLIERKGIAGFSEDAGRVLAGFVYSNARQTSQNLHTGEMVQAANDIPKGMGELKDKATKLVEYIKHPQEEAQKVRGLLFAQYIGGSIASAMVNMTQPLTMTLPWLTQFGGLSKASKQMAAAVKDATRKTTGDKALDAALKRGEEDGTVSPQEVHDLMRQAQGKGALKSGDGTKLGNAAATAQNVVSRIGFGWGKLFSTAEQFNRRATFIAAYRTAVEQGMKNPDAFARRAIHETQGVYNKGNKPDWARGAVGATLFTFKQYSIAYVEMLHRMATTGEPGSPERAAGRRGALYALAVLMLLSGLGGMPGADDLDDIISGLMQALGYNFDSKAKRKAFLAEYLGDGAAQFMERGVSGLAGVPIDISGRMGLGNLIPATGLLTKKADHTSDVAELLGPAGDLAKRAFQAGGKLIDGDVLGNHGAIATAAPKAVQNLFQAADMADKGMYRDQTGKKVMETGPGDALAKALGFQPNDVKRQQDATWEVKRMVDLNRITETEIADRWAIGLFEKDMEKVQGARDDLAKWNADNPSSPIKISFQQIRQRVNSMNMTKAERIAKTAPKEIKATVRSVLSQYEPG